MSLNEQPAVIEPPQTAEIDREAPDFEARTTHGIVRLSDYRGRWLVLFSHPADFTPVCTSEFIAFQKAAPHFAALDTDLLGLSVDSVFAHLAWVNDLKDRFGVQITFPIIEDISMAVARAYGMIHDQSTSTATVRSLFFIDPHGIIRAIIHYPMNIGRSADEILRVLSALQEADANTVATPEGWRPGDRTVLPPPVTEKEVIDRETHQEANKSWYFTEVNGVTR